MMQDFCVSDEVPRSSSFVIIMFPSKGAQLCVVAIFFLMLCILFRDGDAVSVRQVRVESEARTQTVNVKLPNSYSEDSDSSFPIMVLLHGLNGSGGGIAAYYGMDGAADDLDFIYIAPDAVNRGASSFYTNRGNGRGWCASSICCCGGRTLTCNNQCVARPELDADFLRDMILQVSDEFNVDRNRVYVMGISNGAYMAYRMVRLLKSRNEPEKNNEDS